MRSLTFKYALQVACPRVLLPYWQRLEASAWASRLAKGAFWSFSGTVVSRGLMLVSSILLVRMLGKHTFGEYGMLRSTIDMFAVFAGYSVGLTATKHVAEFRDSDPARAGRIIALCQMFAAGTGLAMGLALFLLGPWLAENTLSAPHLAGLLRLSSLVLLMVAISGAHDGALGGFEAFRATARVKFLVGLLSLPLLVGAAYTGGLLGLLWGLLLLRATHVFLSGIALRREAARFQVPIAFGGLAREWNVLWLFSLPAVLAALTFTPANWVCNTILVNQEGGYSQLGVYAAVLNLSFIVQAVNGTIAPAFLPLCVSNFGNHKPKFEFVNIVLPWAIGLVFTVPLICVPEVAGLIYGESFSGPSMNRTVVFIMFFTVIREHRQGIARNFVAGNYLWWSTLGNAFWAVLAIVGTYLLRHRGAEGMAAAFAIAYALNTIVFIPFYVAKRLCPKHLLFSKYALSVWLSIGLAASVSLMQAHVWTRASVLLLATLTISRCLVQWWKKLPETVDGSCKCRKDGSDPRA
jgi:O-antigen/teichoic acid export membrane protein